MRSSPQFTELLGLNNTRSTLGDIGISDWWTSALLVPVNRQAFLP
jgi:hypothetical protein